MKLEQTAKRTVELPVIWYPVTLKTRQCNENVIYREISSDISLMSDQRKGFEYCTIHWHFDKMVSAIAVIHMNVGG